MERNDAARLLGTTTTASARQVRSAFRKKVRTDHPDASGRDGVDFQRLVEARDLLLTPAPVPKTLPPKMEVGKSNRPVPKRTEMTYGYDPNARVAEPDPITNRTKSKPMGAGKVKDRKIRTTTIATMVAVSVFLLIVLVGILGSGGDVDCGTRVPFETASGEIICR